MSLILSQFQKQVFNLAKEKGWWPIRNITDEDGAVHKNQLIYNEISIPEKIALMHSELSEALEEYRTSSSSNAKDFYFKKDENNEQKPEGLFIELADCIIRILDLAEAYDIDMEHLLIVKHKYNSSRSFRHDGKKC